MNKYANQKNSQLRKLELISYKELIDDHIAQLKGGEEYGRVKVRWHWDRLEESQVHEVIPTESLSLNYEQIKFN